ncbi:chaperone binding protein [Culex quinquefasciatus]|uniref:Chaperone binding protein n=1 Tax=Culex quinquefasciatus TaxID=7176 RepID=B0XJZ9_CULQU|nr:chaperone binding protein [Culex quinquefasciatus]|eukprot:XP_001869971.1 chaperone binding protein [Culex quinquefasciatus]
MSSSAAIKREYYQTDTAVTVTVLLKNATEKNYAVAFAPDKVELTADGIEPIVLNLWAAINVERSTHKAYPSKVEIKLAKLEGHRWEDLEKKVTEVAKPPPKKTHHDWDKISKDIEKAEAEEKPEGEAAVQDLFRKIYADANEDTKKAMMKSFYESGGTVLSTNWQEVGAKPVEVKPPDGCEFKKWD